MKHLGINLSRLHLVISTKANTCYDIINLCQRLLLIVTASSSVSFNKYKKAQLSQTERATRLSVEILSTAAKPYTKNPI